MCLKLAEKGAAGGGNCCACIIEHSLQFLNSFYGSWFMGQSMVVDVDGDGVYTTSSW